MNDTINDLVLNDRWPPAQNDMPDLSHLNNPLTLSLIFKALIFKAGYANPIAQALWTHYVRRMSQSVGEYIRARRTLDEFVSGSGHGVLPLFQATAHMETCVRAIRRAVRFARRLRKQRDFPHAGELAVLSDFVSQRLDALQTAMDALEQATLNREIDAETPMMLMVKQDGIQAGESAISYIEIAAWLEDLCQLATFLTDYREPEDKSL